MKIFDNIQKKVLILSLVISIGVIFQGCAFIRPKSPEISEIITNIQKVTDLSAMKKGNKSNLRKIYSINTKGLNDFVLYAPKNNMQANQILILKVVNEDDMDGLLENLENIIEAQSNSFKEYSPDQYEILENHTLKIKGNYLILIVSKDVDKITKAVNDSFK
ncbi:DUF4358 domain-containing protein [Clostridium estertheticum]|uniref:DUF4358 domain-containing protein n=1 Tax=Clostridium estertheticum TaxID=238834 RepID=UPI001CF42084|nr:DUF4358 domain-containing protein [Clostridium estertheticum]MCB2353796.1 DUF4358 domain-containing protein [Clostridium estertheticum]WAG40504.1 DUF4358 domain-containing protein [Clostridium estertheticum]